MPSFVADDRRQIKKHLTNAVALKVVYNNEVCTDEYGNPRSAFLLLHYIPSTKTFLLCKQVKNIEAAQSKLENQALPAHDIRHPLGQETQQMVGINLKRLLPPSRVQAEAPEPASPSDRKQKRKGSSKGETSHPKPKVTPEVARGKTPRIGVDDLLPSDQLDTELDLGNLITTLERKTLAPVWMPSFEAFRDTVRSDATMLRTGEVGSNTASALSEVARLLADMEVWRQSTDQEVLNNLRRGLMMVSLFQTFSLFSVFHF